MHHVLHTAATRAERDLGQLLEAVGVRLATELERREQLSSELKREEEELVAQLLREHRDAATARLFTDDALIQRVARAESHAAKQLDRAFALLARLQSCRDVISDAEEPIGFVLRNGAVNAGASGSLLAADLSRLAE